MEGHGALDTEASAVSPADYTAAGMGSGWGRGWGDELWVLDERQRQRQLEDMYEPHQFIGQMFRSHSHQGGSILPTIGKCKMGCVHQSW